jgi:hypothetical protein
MRASPSLSSAGHLCQPRKQVVPFPLLPGDHLGTTRYPCARTTRSWPPVVPSSLNASELRRRLLPRSGGQGAAGSNPAVPTSSQAFPNILTQHQTQQKSHPLPNSPPKNTRRPCAQASYQDIYPNRQRQRSQPAKGSNIAEPPRPCTATPDNREPTGHQPPRTGSGPQHRGHGRAGALKQACPRAGP